MKEGAAEERLINGRDDRLERRRGVIGTVQQVRGEVRNDQRDLHDLFSIESVLLSDSFCQNKIISYST